MESMSSKSKTMHPPPPRRVEWANPNSTCSNRNNSKRQKRDDQITRPATTTRKPSMPVLFRLGDPRVEPTPSKNGSKSLLCDEDSSPELKQKNQLLAGYMAHEFLTKGTLLGERPFRLPSPRPEPPQHEYERYVRLTQLLKTPGGPKLPGIVNPTQLAQFLGMSSSKEGKTL